MTSMAITRTMPAADRPMTITTANRASNRYSTNDVFTPATRAPIGSKVV